jgi:hypothetical protein
MLNVGHIWPGLVQDTTEGRIDMGLVECRHKSAGGRQPTRRYRPDTYAGVILSPLQAGGGCIPPVEDRDLVTTAGQTLAKPMGIEFGPANIFRQVLVHNLQDMHTITQLLTVLLRLLSYARISAASNR